MPRILISGATSGIGEASARLFSSHGWDLILIARRTEKLETLSSTLSLQFPKITVKWFTVDVTDKEQVKSLMSRVDEPIDVLLNNAGLALGRCPLDKGLFEDWDQMIDTNLKGILYLTKSILPFLQQAKHPIIINIGSTAAKEVYENGNVYCATKHAVDALTKAMRIDLLQKNIRVSCIHPGHTRTSFSTIRFKGDQEQADKVYEGFTPLEASDVANVVYFCSSQPPSVSVHDIVIAPSSQATVCNVRRS